MADSDDARPARENRLPSDRSERAVIPIRTRFAYRTPSGGRRKWPAVTATSPTAASSSHAHRNTTIGVQRMVAAFGDDADLEVAIRRAATVGDCAAQPNQVKG